MYEGLLKKNANEKKSGAGQYFTPRPLIDSMVAVMKPTLDDVIQDPAAGTGGFLIAANHYQRHHHDFDSLTEAQQRKYQKHPFFGMEHVQDPHRLALMNLMLHGIDGGIRYGDTLSPEGQALPKATLNLSPPFGTKKGGGLPTRDWIAQRDDSLDIARLKDDSAESSADLPEPSVLATEALGELEHLMNDLRSILAELGEPVEESAA